MSQMDLIPAAASQSLSPIIYKDFPCISTEMLAQAYEVGSNQIRMNFSHNKERFTEGKHYFLLEGEDLNRVKSFYSVHIGKNARGFTLWTERGAARHAKMLNSDKAWDVFEMLEETFFNQPAKTPAPSPAVQPADAPLTPDQQCTIHDIVRNKIEAITGVSKGKRGGLYPEIWSRFNNHFRIARYSQLPQSRMSEAISYLMKMDVAQIKKEMSAVMQAKEPSSIALPAGSAVPSIPEEMMPDYHKQIESALNEALSKLNLAYQLQNFHGTRYKTFKGDKEHIKYLHIACMSNINAAAAMARTLLAVK